MLVAAVAVAMAVGSVGTVLPFLPGLALVWVAALAYGLVDGFGWIGLAAMVVITVLFALGSAAGIVLPHRAAVAADASSWSLWLGAALAVVGFFVVPVVGLLLGGVVGVFVGELWRCRDGRRAWRATWATIKGFGWATLAQLASALAMVVVWIVWVVA